MKKNTSIFDRMFRKDMLGIVLFNRENFNKTKSPCLISHFPIDCKSIILNNGLSHLSGVLIQVCQTIQEAEFSTISRVIFFLLIFLDANHFLY